MENKQILGYYIKCARMDQGLTQAQLARRLKTKQTSIARAETRGCSLPFAEKAVGALGFEITNIALRAADPFKKHGLTFASI